MRTVPLVMTFVVCLGLTSTSSHGQAKASPSEIDSLVNELSWNSVGGECNGFWRVYPTGHAAKRLIEIGKPATPQLLRVLNDEARGVAAHLILTAMWERKGTFYYENRLEVDASEVAYFMHAYNGLQWTDRIDLKSGSLSSRVGSIDLAKNSERWNRKLAGRRGRKVLT